MAAWAAEGDDWGFALYDPATENHESAVLRTGLPYPVPASPVR
jgi:hypothetical protein